MKEIDEVAKEVNRKEESRHHHHPTRPEKCLLETSGTKPKTLTPGGKST